jgi:hypothetical protein
MVGLGIAAAGLGMRAMLHGYRNMKALSKLTGTSAFTHYYKGRCRKNTLHLDSISVRLGGFEPNMSRREACLILGVR